MIAKKTFNSYRELELFIKDVEKMENISWSIRNSTSISPDNINIIGDGAYRNIVAKRLVVSSAYFECERGKARESIAKLRKTTTKKLGCGAFFYVVACKNKLVIKRSNFEHCSFCTGRYKRKPMDITVKNMVELLLRNQTPTQNIARYISYETGEYYSTKDIHNLFKVRSKNWTVEEAIGELKTSGGDVWKLNNDEKKLVGVVYQSKQMFQDFEAYGDIVILDSTFKLTNLNWTFFILLGVDSNLRSVPFCAFAVHNETYNMLSRVFEIISKHNDMTKTSYIITDKDLAERKVVKKYFPNGHLHLCRFHVLKSFETALQKIKGIDKKIRSHNNNIIRMLCYLENPELYTGLISKFHPHVKEYFDKNWAPFKKEFIPAFKETTMNMNIHTTNNIEIYFGLIKKTIKKRQELGNFLMDIKVFFDNKNRILEAEESRGKQRIPNKKIPIFIEAVRLNISNYAFETLIEIETNSHFLTTSKSTYLFDEQKCCVFKKTFGLPCIHSFYNNRNMTKNELLSRISTRWLIEKNKEQGYECEDFTNKENHTENISTNSNSNINRSDITKTEKSDCSESVVPCETIVLEEMLTTPNNENSKNRLNKFMMFGKKLCSIIANKKISEDSGMLILEKICDFVEQTEIKKIMMLISPTSNIVTQNESSNRKIIKKLLDSDLMINNSQKGRRRKNKYKR